jgi:integrase
MSCQRAAAIVSEAASAASQRLAARGLRALPNRVMSQVGHADSKMTMDVYAQLLQREHGRAFDA